MRQTGGSCAAIPSLFVLLRVAEKRLKHMHQGRANSPGAQTGLPEVVGEGGFGTHVLQITLHQDAWGGVLENT